MSGLEEQRGYRLIKDDEDEAYCEFCGSLWSESELCEECLGCPNCCAGNHISCSECGGTTFRLIEYGYRVIRADIESERLYDEDSWESSDWEGWECDNCSSSPTDAARHVLERLW